MDKKVILITGGSGLIGREIIVDLLKNGAIALNLDIVVDDDWEEGTLHCDITDNQSILGTIGKVLMKYQKIDGLVNNAYPRTTDWGNSFENISPDSWDKNLSSQLGSYFFFCQQVLKNMKDKRNGSIVNIASIYGSLGNDFSLYEN